MKNMNDRNDRNDKVMDIILEAATDKYAQDIADEAVECDMSAEEEKTMLKQQDRIYQNVMKQIRKGEKPSRNRLFKKCAVLAASLAIIISLAANVSAFRTFIFKTYTDMSGTILNIKTQKVTGENFNSISEFEYKDEIIIPGWLPPGLSLTRITDDCTGAVLEYEGDNLWLTIDENSILSNVSSVQVETDKNKFKIGEIKVLDMNGILVEIRSEKEKNIFVASWNSDNVKYELATNGSKIMLDTVLQHLEYLK